MDTSGRLPPFKLEILPGAFDAITHPPFSKDHVQSYVDLLQASLDHIVYALTLLREPHHPVLRPYGDAVAAEWIRARLAQRAKDEA